MILGAALMVSIAAETSASAQVTSGAYELFCPETPVGNIVMNNVSTSGTMSPADPSAGQQFNVTGYQTLLPFPASIASAAQALGNSALVGTARTGIGATGATPQTMTVGPLDINVPIPRRVPNSGVVLSLPSAPETLGPFTATSSDITIQEDAMTQITLSVSGSNLDLTCQAYPNNSAPTGIITSAPKGAPVAPVIASAGASTPTTTSSSPTTTSTSPPQSLTGAYELYCPNTPVGSIVLNDAMTSATLSPADPSAGQSFSLTGYQTVVNLPAALATAAAAVSPGQPLAGSATVQIDASGATPAQTPEGPLDFSVPFPTPIPASGVSLSLPSSAATVSGFTATSSDVTIQEDSSASLSLNVAGSALALTCTAFPNDSLTPSGITTGVPSSSPIAPVIALAGGGESTTTTTEGATTTTEGATTTTEGATTTTEGATTTTSGSGPGLTGAYELYCPGTPVGNIALNDVVTTATLSPSNPSSGQSFSVTGYSTTANLPASLASAAAAISPTLSGSASTQIDASGATPAKTPEGPLNFSVTIPSPVPSAGVALTLPSTPANVSGFTATGGPVTITEDSSASLTLSISGSDLDLACTAYPNDSITPSGITTSTPSADSIAPVIATSGGSTGPTTTTTTGTGNGAPTSLTGSLERRRDDRGHHHRAERDIGHRPGHPHRGQRLERRGHGDLQGVLAQLRHLPVLPHVLVVAGLGLGLDEQRPGPGHRHQRDRPGLEPRHLGRRRLLLAADVLRRRQQRPVALRPRVPDRDRPAQSFCPVGTSWLSVQCFMHFGHHGQGGQGGQGNGNGNGNGNGGQGDGNGGSGNGNGGSGNGNGGSGNGNGGSGNGNGGSGFTGNSGQGYDNGQGHDHGNGGSGFTGNSGQGYDNGHGRGDGNGQGDGNGNGDSGSGNGFWSGYWNCHGNSDQGGRSF